MADQFQIELLQGGVAEWNTWRKNHPDILVDLSAANLKGLDFTGIDFEGANLSHSNFTSASLKEANLKRANLRHSVLKGVNLKRANLALADLEGALLSGSYLRGANLKKANLQNVDLRYTSLVESNLADTTLDRCKIYGLSAWGLKGIPANQTNLIITPLGEPEITVDDLQVAQFVYLLLNNKNVRNVIDTITSKAVLILGRFVGERKLVLDALHNELRIRNYLPILFDFSGPENRDITETVSTLAHLARFVIADVTDAKSVLQELRGIVPDLPSLPIQPLLLSSQTEPGMFSFFQRFPWVLDTHFYKDAAEVIGTVDSKIINPLEAKFLEVRPK